eukprot:4054033-Alexandrium_andersonii.AAC.1
MPFETTFETARRCLERPPQAVPRPVDPSVPCFVVDRDALNAEKREEEEPSSSTPCATAAWSAMH